MKPEMKKLIIANLPYLLFVYLFGKLGQAYRLAEGIDLSQKLLHFADGCAAAFESAAPSFNPFDLLIGVAGAAALRLMVYCKGKNAKKYRKGVEYGSARWGTAKDIAPYIDPKFENNILLTQTERLTMTGRPKDPKTARNKNALVIGGSGSGKTRFFEQVDNCAGLGSIGGLGLGRGFADAFGSGHGEVDVVEVEVFGISGRKLLKRCPLNLKSTGTPM